MRVVAGKYGGRILHSLEGNNTRPTLDRVKEAIFSIIQNDLYNASVLDLFSGSGGLGIEALSRGAKYCLFNDNNKRANKVIKDNLDSLNVAEEYDLYCLDYKKVLESVANKKFDIVLLDPPYKDDITSEIVMILKNNNSLNEHAVVVVETSFETITKDIEGFSKKEYKYGTVKVSVYRS